MVIRSTALVPEMCEAFFQCAKCNHEIMVEIEKGRINEPTICPACSVSFFLIFRKELKPQFRQQNQCN